MQPISAHLGLSPILVIKLVLLEFPYLTLVAMYLLMPSCGKKAATIFPNPYKRIVVMGLCLKYRLFIVGCKGDSDLEQI